MFQSGATADGARERMVALQKRRLQLERETERLTKILKRAKSKAGKKWNSEVGDACHKTELLCDGLANSKHETSMSALPSSETPMADKVVPHLVCSFPSIHAVDIGKVESEFSLPDREYGQLMRDRVAACSSEGTDVSICNRNVQSPIPTISNHRIGINRDGSRDITGCHFHGNCCNEDCNKVEKHDDSDDGDGKQETRSLPASLVTTGGDSVARSGNFNPVNSRPHCLGLEFYSERAEMEIIDSVDVVGKESLSEPVGAVGSVECGVGLRMRRQQIKPARKSKSLSIGSCVTPPTAVTASPPEEANVPQQSAVEESENNKLIEDTDVHEHGHEGLFDVKIRLQHSHQVEAISCTSSQLSVCDGEGEEREQDVTIIAVSTTSHLVLWRGVTADQWQVIHAIPLNTEEGEAVKQVSLVAISPGVCVVAGGWLGTCHIRMYHLVSTDGLLPLDISSDQSCVFKHLCTMSCRQTGLEDDYVVEATLDGLNCIRLMRHTIASWREVVGHCKLPMQEAINDLHSLQPVAHYGQVVGTTSSSVFVWCVSSCHLLCSVSLSHSYLAGTMLCLCAVREEGVIYVTLIHSAVGGQSGCKLAAIHVAAGVCTQLIDYPVPSGSHRFVGVGSDTGKNIVAVMDAHRLGVWDKLSGQCRGLSHCEVDITTSCCHASKELLLIGQVDGNVLVTNME